MSIRRPALVFDNVTVITNAILRSPHLSPAEKGMLGYILSHAAGYELTMKQVIAENRAGRDAIDTPLKGLEQRGYLRRVRQRSERGQLGGYDWEVTIDAVGCPTGTIAGNPALVASSGSGEFSQVGTSAGKPSVGNASVGNPAPKKLKVLELELDLELQEQNPPAPAEPDPFDGFWEVYPAKKGKIAARKAFVKALKHADVETIIAGALRYRSDSRVVAGYVKDPATWLNGGHWEDELTTAGARTNGHRAYQDPTDISAYLEDL